MHFLYDCLIFKILYWHLKWKAQHHNYTFHTFSETWTANINRREEEVCCSWDFRNWEELCWCSENDSRGKLHFIPFSDALMPKLQYDRSSWLSFCCFFFLSIFSFPLHQQHFIKRLQISPDDKSRIFVNIEVYINNLIIKIIINHDQY